MKASIFAVFLAASAFSPAAIAGAKVMNAGEAHGQLVFLSEEDVRSQTDKFRSLNVFSVPVFAELPMELTVVAGAITLKQQNLLSHVQIKSRARRTPNLDISALEGGMANPLFSRFKEGDFIHMLLTKEGGITLEPSSEAEALAFYEKKKSDKVEIRSDLSATRIFGHNELSWRDFDKVGSKAANYAELARALNSPERTVVRPGFALPFYYYQQFVEMNPEIDAAIRKILKDPLMNKPARVAYRQEKLSKLQEMILSEKSLISQDLVDQLIAKLDTVVTADGHKRRMKLRSSTNAEDLPNFNGAGLYTSESYKPEKNGKEKSKEKKESSLKEALRIVWASIWNLRAFDERAFFQIPHADVKMGVQLNPSFADEGVDGVVVTKNMAGRPELSGRGVYVEAQRGDVFSVANPESGTKPEQILVLVEESEPLDVSAYRIHVLQKSNVADDGKTILPHDNPNPVMSEGEIRDLVFQSLKAEAHFKSIFGRDDPEFSLDIEFKVDSEDTGGRQVYLKQARPYID